MKLTPEIRARLRACAFAFPLVFFGWMGVWLLLLTLLLFFIRMSS